jgi:hypothetical protein
LRHGRSLHQPCDHDEEASPNSCGQGERENPGEHKGHGGMPPAKSNSINLIVYWSRQ